MTVVKASSNTFLVVTLTTAMAIALYVCPRRRRLTAKFSKDPQRDFEQDILDEGNSHLHKHSRLNGAVLHLYSSFLDNRWIIFPLRPHGLCRYKWTRTAYYRHTPPRQTSTAYGIHSRFRWSGRHCTVSHFMYLPILLTLHAGCPMGTPIEVLLRNTSYLGSRPCWLWIQWSSIRVSEFKQKLKRYELLIWVLYVPLGMIKMGTLYLQVLVRWYRSTGHQW